MKYFAIFVSFAAFINGSDVFSSDFQCGTEEKQAYSWEIKGILEELLVSARASSSSYFVGHGSLFLEKKDLFGVGKTYQGRYITRPSDNMLRKTPCDRITNEYLWVGDDAGHCSLYCFDVTYYSSRLEAFEALIRSEMGLLQKPPIAPYPPMTATPPPVCPATFDYPLLRTKPFFFLSWKGKPIGDISFGDRLWGNPEYRLYGVVFLRGNMLVRVFRTNDPGLKFDGKSDESTLEQFCVPDPREIAWKIDRYLKGDPLDWVGEEVKRELKTLEITISDASQVVLGKELTLDFPRTLPDGTVPAEIRLVVSRGEIQQISENPTLAPTFDGQYTVLFGQPGHQTVRCYHLDETGQILAWGEMDVEVKAEE